VDDPFFFLNNTHSKAIANILSRAASFTEEKVPDLIDQLERQKAALPDSVHVFFFNKAEKEIPSGVRQKIEDAGFTIIARNNSPKRATALLKQLRAGN